MDWKSVPFKEHHKSDSSKGRSIHVSGHPERTICASIRIDGQIIATGLGILDRDYIGIYAIHVKEEYRKHGYARRSAPDFWKRGWKKVRRMLTFRSLKEMIMPGHFINHSDFTIFIPTGSACSQMKWEFPTWEINESTEINPMIFSNQRNPL